MQFTSTFDKKNNRVRLVAGYHHSKKNPTRKNISAPTPEAARNIAKTLYASLRP